MKNYLDTYDHYGIKEDLNDTINTAFIKLMNGYNNLTLSTEFGKVLVSIEYGKKVHPYDRVYVFKQKNAPVNEFTSRSFQDGFNYYIQLTFHTSIRRTLFKYKELVYMFLMHGMISAMYDNICTQICKKMNVKARISKKDKRNISLILNSAFIRSYDNMGLSDRDRIVNDIIASSANPISITLNDWWFNQMRVCFNNYLNDALDDADDFNKEIHHKNIYKDDVGYKKLNSFYECLVNVCAYITIPDDNLSDLLTEDNFNRYNEQLFESATEFIIGWILGAYKEIE